MEQVRNRLEATGKVTSEQIDRMLIHFADPGWSALSPIIMTAWGRRPTFG
jgi:hypothetical protein